MKTGKVILIGGSKRAGKTTLAMMLHKRAGFNYLNFDHLEDAIDVGINKTDGWNDGEYFKGFLEEMIDYSLEDAKNYGINTVIDTYMYNPDLIDKLKNKNEIEIYYLACLDCTEEELRVNLKKYSASYDWPSYCTEEQFENNIKDIIARNEFLKEECKKYKMNLINTSNGQQRVKILNELVCEITNSKSKGITDFSFLKSGSDDWEKLINKIDKKIKELEKEELKEKDNSQF